MRLWSEIGKGSTFSFTVALAPASEEAAAQFQNDLRALTSEVARVSLIKRPLRVLLAEDNVVNQRLIAELVKKEGHEVVVVGNGHDAVAAVHAGAFDVVFVDVQMPAMDGFEATGAIQRMEKSTFRHTAIVAMTATTMKDDRQKSSKPAWTITSANRSTSQRFAPCWTSGLPLTRFEGITRHRMASSTLRSSHLRIQYPNARSRGG